MSFARPAVAGPLSVEATKAAYERHLVAKGDYSGSWETLADLFADDASYYDVFYGWMYGKDAIRRFLRDSMKGIEDWSFPVQWTVVGEGRVVVHWLNRLPGTRPDGTHYEFPGTSSITYDANGKIAQQMDLYDGIAAINVVTESKLGFVGRGMKSAFGWAGPLAREAIRSAYMVFDRSSGERRQ
jgi:ketosteroid isomerase-like protein